MDGWQPVQLSPSKLPIYQDGEIETVVQKAVALYEGEKVSKYERCVCYLTSHRLILQDQDNKLAPIGFLHANLAAVDSESGGITGSPKIKFFLVGRNSVSYKLSFRSGNRDEFLAKWKQVVQSKAWVQKSAEEGKKKEVFSTTKAGITGIMRTTEQKAKDTDKTLQEAFSDISALMEKAREMVGLAEKFTSSLTKETKGTEQDNELRSMLISMGIASPVTKESAGSLYHTQLSRQLADWLHKPLEKSGGMLALPDLYSLFNRARGTSLVSPDDLYRACVLFEELGVPVRLKKFESGVLVVQSVNYNDDTIGKQIADLIRLDGPQTAFEVARTKNISIALATEELLTAERLGLVCRDETLEGVTFYLNFFNDRNLVKLYLKS